VVLQQSETDYKCKAQGAAGKATTKSREKPGDTTTKVGSVR